MSRKRSDGWDPLNHVWWQTKRARIDKGAGVGACDASKPVGVSSLGLARQDSFPVLRGGDDVCWRGPRPTAASKLGERACWMPSARRGGNKLWLRRPALRVALRIG